MSPRLSRLLKLGAKLAVAGLLLTLVLRRTNTAELRAAFAQVRWSCVLGVWAVNLVEFWILSFNMRLILRRQDCDARTGALFSVSAVTALYGLILPGMLDSSVKWYLLKRHTGKGIHVFSGMAFSQVAAMCTTVCGALGALAVMRPWDDPRLSLGCWILMAALVGLYVLLFHPRTGPKFIGLLRRTVHLGPAWLWRVADRVLDQLRLFQSASWRFHLQVASLHLLGMTVLAAVIYVLAARAAWIEVSVGDLVWIGAAVYILSRLPISVANLGWREWTLTGLLGLFGAGPSQVLVMSAVLLSNKLVIAAVGAVIQGRWALRGEGGLPRTDAPRPPDSCR